MNAIVLIGPPGAGKTSVGRRLAQILGQDFTDTDQVVEAEAGMSVADIFLTEGEAGFRARERAAVSAALAACDGVIALGGGAVLDPTIRDQLADHLVIFLDVSVAQAAPRIGFARSRPLLVGSPRARWSELMAARRPTYEGLASAIVNTDGLSVAQISAQIAATMATIPALGGGRTEGKS